MPRLIEIPLASLTASPFQPRGEPDQEELEQLAESIRQEGILQPLVVRQSGPGWELIAGERRMRAARLVGLTSVPVTVLEADDARAAAIALAENLAREQLTPYEEAVGITRLYDLARDSGEQPSQQDLAAKTGRSAGSVSESLRIGRALTSEVIDAAGLAHVEVRGLPKTSLLAAAKASNPEAVAQLLRLAVSNRAPEGRTERKARRRTQTRGTTFSVSSRAVGMRLQLAQRPEQHSAEEAQLLLEQLRPVIRALEDRAIQNTGENRGSD